eukprot:10681095-Prorocentrum_lima.AAC.1
MMMSWRYQNASAKRELTSRPFEFVQPPVSSSSSGSSSSSSRGSRVEGSSCRSTRSSRQGW